MQRPNSEQLMLVFFVVVAIASGADIAADIKEGVNTFHLIQEVILLATTAIAFIGISYGLLEKNRELRTLKLTLAEISQLPAPASADVIHSKKLMAEAIKSQFNRWELSNSEQAVGLLLLKGFSVKEIAALRGTSEKTIRQQASAIYKKSGLSGRHVLSAWFIEDFL